MDPSVGQPFLELEFDSPRDLPKICVCCGEDTTHQTRIDTPAGDSSTEVMDLVKGALPVKLPSTVKVPCCRKCAWKLNMRTLLAASLFFVGLGLFFATSMIHNSIVPIAEEIWMVVTFVAFMTALVGPTLVYAKVRNKMIPVHVSRLSGGRYRYVFHSHLFKGAVERSRK